MPTTIGMAILAILLSPGAGFGFSFQGLGNLGTLPADRPERGSLWVKGFTSCNAWAMSDDGRTVVGRVLEVQGENARIRGFVWTMETGFRVLPLPAGYDLSAPTDVSAGQSTGWRRGAARTEQLISSHWPAGRISYEM